MIPSIARAAFTFKNVDNKITLWKYLDYDNPVSAILMTRVRVKTRFV